MHRAVRSAQMACRWYFSTPCRITVSKSIGNCKKVDENMFICQIIHLLAGKGRFLVTGVLFYSVFVIVLLSVQTFWEIILCGNIIKQALCLISTERFRCGGCTKQFERVPIRWSYTGRPLIGRQTRHFRATGG